MSRIYDDGYIVLEGGQREHVAVAERALGKPPVTRAARQAVALPDETLMEPCQ